ncbi:SCO4225 family membrane protein [Streptomyces sp. NPDC050416]|uniref:SCO4225 family membrane protein n=1 Tax=Streptomyces sp. NPDC050416 TaxID=3365611 RepID=UPI0037990E89
MTAAPPGRPLSREAAHALRHPAALVYLAACAILLAWALVVTLADGTDESMAAVIPLLATAPVSLVLLLLPDHGSMLVAAVVLGALANALIIGWCARALRRGDSAH